MGCWTQLDNIDGITPVRLETSDRRGTMGVLTGHHHDPCMDLWGGDEANPCGRVGAWGGGVLRAAVVAGG